MQNAKKRELCYEARDLYHKCLDTLPEDSEKECLNQKKDLEKACPSSWIKYFEKQREREVILQLQLERSSGRER
ncbi:Cytochrome c oxidase [Trypanosoma melophagium]|uniref:Cytochrome c oxidase n=1 Tax=Trypanosoma melophagium TaxID=715481 RepID=UPI00351A7CDD|nr:Cytochrome c oxidase [Trypanosoma melophagium]